MRTLGSVNHPGPMKSRSRSCYAAAPKAGVGTIRRSAAWLGWPPGPGHSSWNVVSVTDFAYKRVGKGAWHTGAMRHVLSWRRAHASMDSHEATRGQRRFRTIECVESLRHARLLPTLHFHAADACWLAGA